MLLYTTECTIRQSWDNFNPAFFCVWTSPVFFLPAQFPWASPACYSSTNPDMKALHIPAGGTGWGSGTGSAPPPYPPPQLHPWLSCTQEKEHLGGRCPKCKENQGKATLTLKPSPKGQVCHEVRLAEEQQWSGTGKRGKSRVVSTLNILIF